MRTRRGAWLDPRIADVFLSLTPDDAIWGRLRADNLFDLLRDLEPPEGIAFADEQELDRVAEAFAGVIDAKSPYTARHSVGVAHHAVGIGQKMGFDAADLRSLRRAGLLHDIGKLGVSNRILDKPDKLTDVEFAAVRRHPLYTEQILSRIAAFADFAEDAAAHHERLDGRGYHRGIGADRLSAMARILAVADVYEALTATRPYRGPLTHEAALDVLWRGAGTAFDPDHIAALEEALQEHDRQIGR